MSEIAGAVYQPPKKVYHMDLQQVLGEVGIGNNQTDQQNNGPKRYPYQIDSQGKPLEIKAGPDINRYLDEINQNLEVSFIFQILIVSIFSCRASKST